MSLKKILCATAILLVLLPFQVSAKDLTYRLGLGYTVQPELDLSLLTMRYFPMETIGFNAGFGVNTESGNSRMALSGQLYKLIFPEEFMNFYIGAAVDWLTHERNGKNKSGFEMGAFMAVEFFFQGLDNLGFSFRTGVSARSLSDGVILKTRSLSPLQAGIFFYF